MSKLSKLKFSLFLLSAIISLSCSNNTVQKNKDIKIAVSIAPFADFTKKIVGNRAQVYTLIPPGQNAHSFDPNPETIKQILNSDIFFRVGEVFNIEKQIINNIDSESTQIVDCSNGIEIMDNDPHIWLSTQNVKIITKNILLSLTESFPQHKNYFANNRSKFIAKLDSINTKIEFILSKKKNKYLFVYHPAWTYFTNQFNLEQIGVEYHGKAPKAKDLGNVLNRAKNKGINCIFFDPHFDDAAVLTIAKSLGLKTDSMNPLPNDYLANLEEIMDKLEIHLK